MAPTHVTPGHKPAVAARTRPLGADTFRMYLVFLGPFQEGGDFRDEGTSGPRRFLDKVWALVGDACGSVLVRWQGISERIGTPLSLLLPGSLDAIARSGTRSAVPPRQPYRPRWHGRGVASD